ncbi:MAG TPA: ABC transporter permease [Verrucomicrobiae bacterium]|jgi:ribose/xylose/arabinose/galactoside ABC-type transport system permease subunit|nr:ABC transporter permease [Verrucomicrobiae bacterium]
MSKLIRQLLPFASLLLILVVLAVLRPHEFLAMDNFLNVFRRSSVNAIMAVGMTTIIISGGIDLSVGSMLALSGMFGAWLMTKIGGDNLTVSSMLIGTLGGIAMGTVCGLLNGLLITQMNLQPFIVTLGTMSAFRGISYVMNDGQPYNVPAYTYLGNGQLAAMPVSILIAAVIVVLAILLLRYTPLGRYTYAIGSNREAAFHAGVNVKRNLTWIYTLGGLLVGIASTIATSRTVSAQPTAGIALELDIIAAVVIGGASLNGGRGTIVGTIIGTLLISFLRNGCTLLGYSTNVQLIIIGIIIIVAVAVDQLARGQAK